MTLELAHSGVGGASAPAGGFTRDDIAPGAGVPVVRRGAQGIIASGNRLRIGWGPTSPGTGFEFEFTYLVTNDHPNLIGRQDTNYWNVVQELNGSLSLRSNNVTQIQTAAGTVEVGGIYHVRAFISSFDIRLYVDGVLLAQGTVGYGIGAGAVDHFILNRGGGATGADAVMWDVTFRDLNNDANTAYFPLDALDSSGNYPNEHPGSTVGDATVTGTVLPVEVNAVTPGSAAPVPVGPVVVSGAMTSPVASSSGFSALLSAVVDPDGWVSSAGITAALDGVGVIEATGRVRATTLAVNPDTTTLRVLSQETLFQELTLDTVNEWIPFALTAAVPVLAGDLIRVQAISHDPSNTVEMDNVYLTLTLYPDLSA